MTADVVSEFLALVEVMADVLLLASTFDSESFADIVEVPLAVEVKVSLVVVKFLVDLESLPDVVLVDSLVVASLDNGQYVVYIVTAPFSEVVMTLKPVVTVDFEHLLSEHEVIVIKVVDSSSLVIVDIDSIVISDSEDVVDDVVVEVFESEIDEPEEVIDISMNEENLSDELDCPGIEIDLLEIVDSFEVDPVIELIDEVVEDSVVGSELDMLSFEIVYSI